MNLHATIGYGLFIEGVIALCLLFGLMMTWPSKDSGEPRC